MPMTYQDHLVFLQEATRTQPKKTRNKRTVNKPRRKQPQRCMPTQEQAGQETKLIQIATKNQKQQQRTTPKTPKRVSKVKNHA